MVQRCGFTLLSLLPLVYTALNLVVQSDFEVRPGSTPRQVTESL